MEVRIYQPSKTAMQSGRAKTHHWLLEFVSAQPQTVDSLMGWTGSRDTRRQVLLRFDTREEAIAYARRQGYTFTVEDPHQRMIKPKSYADNFIRRV